jgi:hypothetical protein
MDGTPAWKMTTAGERTMPLQPAFLGYLASTVTNKTGAGAAYVLGTDALTELFDQSGDFTTAGVFTAPVTGIYNFYTQVVVTGTTIATTFEVRITVSGTSAHTYKTVYTRAASALDQYIPFSVLAQMTATDTATVSISVTGEAGNTDDIVGSSEIVTFFGGTLLC